MLIFCDGSKHDVDKLCQGMYLYKKVTGIPINDQRSTISSFGLDGEDLIFKRVHLPFHDRLLDEGLKYLGFS